MSLLRKTGVCCEHRLFPPASFHRIRAARECDVHAARERHIANESSLRCIARLVGLKSLLEFQCPLKFQSQFEFPLKFQFFVSSDMSGVSADLCARSLWTVNATAATGGSLLPILGILDRRDGFHTVARWQRHHDELLLQRPRWR